MIKSIKLNWSSLVEFNLWILWPIKMYTQFGFNEYLSLRRTLGNTINICNQIELLYSLIISYTYIKLLNKFILIFKYILKVFKILFLSKILFLVYKSSSAKDINKYIQLNSLRVPENYKIPPKLYINNYISNSS